MINSLDKIAFSHYLLTGTLVHEGNFKEMQEQFEIDMHPKVVMIVSIDRYPELAIGKPFSWRNGMGQQLIHVLNKTIEHAFTWIWLEEGALALLLDLTIKQPVTSSFQIMTKHLARRIQTSAHHRGIAVSIGIGGYYDNPYQIHLSFKEAKESMVNRFFQGNQLIFHYEKRIREQTKWLNPITREERADLLACIRVKDEKGAVIRNGQLLSKMAEYYQHDVEMFKSEVTDLIMVITRLVLELGGHAPTILSDNAFFIQDLYKTIRYDNFVQKVNSYVQKLIESTDSDQMTKYSPMLNRAIQYIKENHHRRLSLEEVAQFCSVSLYYFSHQFKKETGRNFVEFVQRIRIKKALYYLENTDYTIQQIAGKIGFEDANYFSRIFKKYVLQTPTKYRKAN
ncbi:helix-turn-helix domain-containing protein [Shimazuella kribbensis]|uniref:helix-turn-helix domain-containing protein n=1 Tax=Shimazuella kribbensis TaxID=139808 RepID=UPI00041F3B1E|nr:helix-turn-helix domain-containing protein [Shimazuella kribbensis]